MLFKIIKVEAVEDKQYGHCTRICANAKPTGIKSVLPYSMITNKYGYDTYKLYVPNESYLIGSAQDAMNAGEFLDIDLNYFRQKEEWDWDDVIMDSNNSYYDLDFDKQNEEEEMEASKQQGRELHEVYLFDIAKSVLKGHKLTAYIFTALFENPSNGLIYHVPYIIKV